MWELGAKDPRLPDPLWEYRPGLEERAGQPRVEGKGAAARRGLEEAVDKRCEATNRNHIKEA